MYGVPKGVYYGQNERVDELNTRIQSRQFSDKPLAPNFNYRPISTKYSLFPVMDRRAPALESIQKGTTHDVQKNFSPATHHGPALTYFNNIDVESGLRNQTTAIQKGAPQSVYVPHSNSDLYRVHVPSTPGPNPHPKLFSRPPAATNFRQSFVQQLPIGRDSFNNHTRTQLRAMS